MKKCSFYFKHIAIFLILNGSYAIAADAKTASNQTVVTFVEGTARVFSKGTTAGRVIKKGDQLNKDSEIRVEDRSRIELRFPDGTIMRLAQNSRLSMDDIRYDKKKGSKNVKVNLGIGKIWAKVKRLATPDSAVEVKTSNAVAGVRGTVYRINVDDDQSSTVKVYDGSVYVASIKKDEQNAAPAQFSAPVPVPGPHEVAPPMHEVTLEEWHVIVKAMQEITISAQGVASKPQEFDSKTDADDWVRWNQERDKQTHL